MVLQALVPIAGYIGGHAARIGVTGSGVRGFAGTFAQSLPFGAGYSFGTYVGFPKNYQPSKTYNKQSPTFTLNTMAYGGYGRRYGRRYSRYGRRRYYRRYRRYSRRYY